MLLAHEKGAELIVSVGAHFNLTEFLDKNRAGMSSTFLTRLRIGETLVDAKGVSRLYNPGVRGWQMWAFLGVALALIAIVVLSSPELREFFDLVWLKIRSPSICEPEARKRRPDLGPDANAVVLVGYSARYHAASLVAVFVALAAGILIGVGFGSDLVSGTAEDLEQSLEADLDQARAEIEDLEAKLDTEREFGEAVAPAIVADRLRGREIALVALGDLDPELADDIRAGVESAGAALQEIAVVTAPPDTAAPPTPFATRERETSRVAPR